MSHDDMPQPVGRAQGGAKSPAGRAAYWRMNYESAIGALADLIAEHTETVEECDALRAERDRLARWKAEATAVIESWEHVHLLLGEPARLGESKAAATYDAVSSLLSERDRLRAEVADLSARLNGGGIR